VWLSEVMLQQTTVAAVTPRFEQFVARWPTIEALAGASDEAILSEWAGLGYYGRARNLIACARQVAGRGGFPSNAAELAKLPGIGAYTAPAIAAIAFAEQVPAVDTNVERVIARLDAIERPSRKQIERLVLAMMPEGRAGDFTQALMDLGATICRPRAPRCSACPVRGNCSALASGHPEAYPARKLKRARPVKQGVAWWIERDGHVWLVRRPATGLLGGMAGLPGSEWTEQPRGPVPHALCSVRHVFTHFTLHLDVAARAEPCGEGWWQPLDQLAGAGLPTLYRRAADGALAASREQRRAA
jgi:A/G-specific adenine glycosylase